MPNALCQNSVTTLIEDAGIAMLDDLNGDALLKRQFDLEDGMKAEGAMRYAKAVDDAKKTKTEGDMVPQKDLIRENVLLVAAGLNEWLETEQARIDAMTGRGRRQYKLPFNWLKELSAPTCAFIGLKTVFNQTGRTRGTAVLAQLIGRAIEEEITVARFVEKMPKLYAKIVDDFTSRSTVHHRRVLRAAIQRHAPELLDFDGNKASQNIQVATGLVVLASIIEKTGLIENELASSKSGTVENIKLAQKTLDYINQRNEIAQFFMPFFKPCVIPPREWTDVRSGGYHGVLAGRHCVVKGRHGDREYIRALRKADMTMVYEGLNYLQGTAWTVNKQVFGVMDQLAYESTQGDLPDVKKVDPLERLPFFDNDAKGWEEWQKKAFKDWKVKNAEIHTENYEKEGAVTNLTATLETARQYLNEERFYFPWNLDTRGRAYPIARGLQPQGSDWQKALLQFAEGQPYDAWARYYLMFHGANCYGETEDGVKLDKELYQTRVEWIEENRDFIFSIADDPMGMAYAWDKVESPWMFLAFCFEFTRCERLMIAGLPAFTHLAPAFDGSCNGLQHFSAALRDEIGGAAVNLTANETPSDIYRLVATKLQAYLMEVAKGVAVGVIEEEVEDDDGKRIKYKLCDVTMARRWLATSKIGRDLCKQPVMTTPYGSNQQGIKMQMVKKLDKQGFKFPALPWNDQDKPSDNFVECTWLAGKIVTAIGEVVVKAREAMDWLQDAARVANKNGSEIWWTAPSGLPIKQFYEDLGHIRIDTEFMGQSYMPRMINLSGTPKLSKHEQVNGIAPNFVHSLDASAMLLTVVRLGRKGIRDFFMIHDSFGVPACFGNDLWQETRNVFVEIYEKHDVLQEFRDGLIETLPEELSVKIKPLPKKGKLDLSEVRRSDFFFA